MSEMTVMTIFEMKDYIQDKGEEITVLTDRNVNRIYDIENLKIDENKKIHTIVIEPGDENKNFDSLKFILQKMIDEEFSRDVVIVAIGGGMILDIAGFTGSIYKRGVKEIIYVPTTFLAMVDAAYGGKNGINLANGKNLVGTFRIPDEVILCTDFVDTLPEREMTAGIAEVIKYSLIASPYILKIISNKNIMTLGSRDFNELIDKCAECKESFFSRDIKDNSIRKILNFGHTIAHAIETTNGFSGVLHGEAVAIGMLYAIKIGMKIGLTEKKVYDIVKNIFEKQNLIPIINKIIKERITDSKLLSEAIVNDKKSTGAGIEMILLEDIGKPVIHEMKYDEIGRLLWEVHGEQI